MVVQPVVRRQRLKASRAGQVIAKQLIFSLGYTFSEVAHKAEISRTCLEWFLKGEYIEAESFYFICQVLKLNPEIIIEFEEQDVFKIERSIEFPPEYWQAGISILSYFSHVLNVKYPSQKIKVRIEQEGLILRMEIETPTGEREKIEKTLEEYRLVITGKIQIESFFSDPFEVMALKNKLEMAALELRQTKQLLDFTRDNSQQRIESLEVWVKQLYSIIGNGLQSGNHVFGVIGKMAEQDKSKYNLSNSKFGGGFATEGGFQVGGSLIDLSSASNLTDAAQQIQELLQQLEEQGISIENAKQQAASDLAKQAEANPTVMGKLVKWGQSLADTAGKTTVSEAVKGVIKLALHISGIPLS